MQAGYRLVSTVVSISVLAGEEGKGFTYQMMQFQEERMWATASSECVCVCAQTCVHVCVCMVS